MTRKERKLLEDMFKDIEHVHSPPAATFNAYMRPTGRDDSAVKMLDSPDYKRGWDQCRVTVYQYLRELGFPVGGR